MIGQRPIVSVFFCLFVFACLFFGCFGFWGINFSPYLNLKVPTFFGIFTQVRGREGVDNEFKEEVRVIHHRPIKTNILSRRKYLGFKRRKPAGDQLRTFGLQNDMFMFFVSRVEGRVDGLVYSTHITLTS